MQPQPYCSSIYFYFEVSENNFYRINRPMKNINSLLYFYNND